jgi:hypothetical protein
MLFDGFHLYVPDFFKKFTDESPLPDIGLSG